MKSNNDISLDAGNELFLILTVSFFEMESFLNIERHFCLKVYITAFLYKLLEPDTT